MFVNITSYKCILFP